MIDRSGCRVEMTGTEQVHSQSFGYGRAQNLDRSCGSAIGRTYTDIPGTAWHPTVIAHAPTCQGPHTRL